MADPILDVRGVSKSFGAVTACRDIDLHVRPGDAVAAGPSVVTAGAKARRQATKNAPTPRISGPRPTRAESLRHCSAARQ